MDTTNAEYILILCFNFILLSLLSVMKMNTFCLSLQNTCLFQQLIFFSIKLITTAPIQLVWRHQVLFNKYWIYTEDIFVPLCICLLTSN